MRMAPFFLSFAVFAAFSPGNVFAQSGSDYSDLAAAVSEPVFDVNSVAKAQEAYTDGGVMSRKEYERQRLNGLARLGGPVQDAREKIAVPLQKCYGTYLEIRRLDNNTPDFEGLAKKTLAAAPGMIKAYKKESLDPADKRAGSELAVKAAWEIGGAIVNSYNLSSERKNYAQYYVASRHANRDVMADLVTKGHAKSGAALAKGDKSITVVDVSHSLAGTYVNDIVEFRNDSGKNLSACSLFVKLRGTKATGENDFDSHFHYVGYWPAGESRYVWYPSRALAGIATNESVDVITEVEVKVHNDQFTDTASLVTAGKRYYDYVKAWADKHLPPNSFTGRWYSDSENLFDPAGFQVTYQGKFPRFTVSKVTVEAVGADTSVRIYNAGPDWAAAQKKWICHKNFNPLNPSKVNVIITFPGTSYEHTVTWNR